MVNNYQSLILDVINLLISKRPPHKGTPLSNSGRGKLLPKVQ